MGLVAEGYNSMTGDELEAQPSVEGLDLKKVQQAIQLLTSSILTETTNTVPVHIEEEDVERPVTAKKKPGRKPKKKVVQPKSNDSLESDDPLINSVDTNIKAGPVGGITKGKVDLRRNKISFPFADFIDENEQEANAKKNKEIRAKKPKIPRPEADSIQCPNNKCKAKLRLNSIMKKYVVDEGKTYYECRCPHCRKEFNV